MFWLFIQGRRVSIKKIVSAKVKKKGRSFFGACVIKLLVSLLYVGADVVVDLLPKCWKIEVYIQEEFSSTLCDPDKPV